MKVPTTAEAAAIGARLARRPILDARIVLRGGNNPLFRLSAADGDFALKFYPRQSADPRDRFRREYEVLSFLVANGIADVPRPLGADADIPCALYQWIDGDAPGAATECHVDAMADFLLRLRPLARLSQARAIPAASAAIFSPAEAVAQAEERLGQLRAAGGTPDFVDFLAGELAPAVARLGAGLRHMDGGLAEELRILSPSDFGLHNALQQADGRLVFLDFEYFGWDDPAKAASDVALHAGMDLSPELGHRFIARIRDGLAASDPGFAERLERLFPIILTIWCMILLNVFRSDVRARREAAGLVTDFGRQLERARALLHRLEQ